MPYKLVKRILSKGWPVSSKRYKKAHKAADKAELKKYGKRKWDTVERIGRKIPKGELAGKHTKSGKIYISERVPGKYRRQVAFHERREHEIMTRKKTKRK